MYVQMNCVIVDADNTNREELASFLVRFGALPVAQFPNIEPLAGILGRPDGPLLAIVNLDPNPADSLKKIATLPRQFPAVNFFLMSQTVDPNLLMEAMHLGIKEFIPLPMSEEKFTTALERVAQVHGMGKRAKIIHVIPTIGGCGSTTIACNVAAGLSPMRQNRPDRHGSDSRRRSQLLRYPLAATPSPTSWTPPKKSTSNCSITP